MSTIEPRMTNDLNLFTASMGKVFKVEAICHSTEEADEICSKRKNLGVISEDQHGHIFLAEIYGSKCPSEIIKKLLH